MAISSFPTISTPLVLHGAESNENLVAKQVTIRNIIVTSVGTFHLCCHLCSVGESLRLNVNQAHIQRTPEHEGQVLDSCSLSARFSITLLFQAITSPHQCTEAYQTVARPLTGTHHTSLLSFQSAFCHELHNEEKIQCFALLPQIHWDLTFLLFLVRSTEHGSMQYKT